MQTGRVVFYDPEANYGFIEPDDGSTDVVFAVRGGVEPVEVGDLVAYELIRRPEVTFMGPEALRLRRLGFAPEPQMA
jgi:cold shock CspA family protein